MVSVLYQSFTETQLWSGRNAELPKVIVEILISENCRMAATAKEFWSLLSLLAEKEFYQDTTVVCQDGKMRATRLLLALAYPLLEEVGI